MSEYIKKYNTGTLTIDLPFPNYIHELPLLTFGDIKGNINISLVHNHKSKLDESANNENPFNISYGYKLNIQKRIIFEEGIPTSFQDTDGIKIELFNYNGVYTFDDDSQRILRTTSSGYELELSDLSKELYNTRGYITAIYDKYGDIYLAYNYTNVLLTSIVYNNSKTVTFSYSSNKLIAINYATTTSSIVYNTNSVIVNHYSGVTNK